VESDKWQSKAAMPTVRSPAAAVTVSGKIYVIGGTNKWPDPLDLVEIYDPASNSWKRGMPLRYARMETGSATANHTIFVVGGSNSSVSWDLSNMEALTIGDK